MITLNQIKLDLIKSLPKYGIRIFFNTDYFASTLINIDITIYNEKKSFGHFLTQKELASNNDLNYTKRVKISFLQKHERFGHYKKSLNKTEMDFVHSPRGVINYAKNTVHVLASKNNKKKGEIGETLEFILTNGNRELIDNIFNLDDNVNLKELYNINIFLESNNSNLIKSLEKFLKNKVNIGKTYGDVKEQNKSQINLNKKEKKIYIDSNKDNNLTLKKENKDDNSSDDEFERRKVEMISANGIRKYTFLRNTIQEYKRINGKLVPINNKK